MAALHIVAFTFFTVTFLGGVFGVTDEEFQDLPPLVSKVIRKMNEEIQDTLRKLKTQELENDRQASVISQQAAVIGHQGEVINRLEEGLFASDRKCKPEVQEAESAKNNTLEERVALLEVQMSDVREDLTITDENVADLDQDVNFLFDEQVIQDEGLLELEQTSVEVIVELAEISVDLLDLNFRVTTLEENGGDDGNSSVAELEVRVETLEGTTADHETRLTTAETDVEDIETRLNAAEENIQGLQATDLNHDARISALEENGGSGGSQNDTVAFHAVLTSYDSIPEQTPVMFNDVLLNEGNGYDSTTGVFTVPPGGNGFYYFSTYLYVEGGEYGVFHMTLNGDRICSTRPDNNNNGGADYPSGSCSAVVNVVAGDEVEVVYDDGSNTTPLYAPATYLYNGFNGFRI